MHVYLNVSVCAFVHCACVCFVGVEGRPHHSTEIKKQNVFFNQEESSEPEPNTAAELRSEPAK